MEGILNNGLIIIPNITKSIEELISYFWQPSMGKDYSCARKEGSNY